MNQFDQAIVNFFPHFVRGNWSKLAAGNLDREIERALVPDVDDHRIRSSVASQEMCDFFDRLLGCGKPDAHQSRLALRAYGFQSHSLAPQRL